MQQTVVVLAIVFAILLIAFRLIELTRPPHRRQPLLRPGFWTDLGYWFFQPLVTRTTTRLAMLVALGPIAWLIHGRVDQHSLMGGYGPLSRLPLWLQAIAILVVVDAVGYWLHRAFHGRRLWSFHAVHHSSAHLDWLAAVRGHPVNDAVMKTATALPVLLLGFAPKALAGVVPILLLMAILAHANVDWDWGPLRRLIVSPRFHRWHHTAEEEGRDKNFAGIFPVWDILFGTYYMPAGRAPARFGTDTPVPTGLLAQLWFPFSRRG